MSHPPGNNSPTSKFVGNWRLISRTVTLDGHPLKDELLGDAPIGYLMYDHTGHMAVQIMRTDRDPSAHPTPSPSSALTAFNGYIAYFGTYTIDEQAQTVTHHLEGAVSASDVGKQQVRHFAFTGDTLLLTIPAGPKDPTSSTLRWEPLR